MNNKCISSSLRDGDVVVVVNGGVAVTRQLLFTMMDRGVRAVRYYNITAPK